MGETRLSSVDASCITAGANGKSHTESTSRTEHTFRVRCLGPGKEHTFASSDKMRERICKACREKMQAVGMALRERPLPVRLD